MRPGYVTIAERNSPRKKNSPTAPQEKSRRRLGRVCSDRFTKWAALKRSLSMVDLRWKRRETGGIRRGRKSDLKGKEKISGRAE